MPSINPENKCAHLAKKYASIPTIQEMFTMQMDLQLFYASKGKALSPKSENILAKVNDIAIQWKNFNLEMSELIERLPHKAWKSYTDEDIKKAFEGDEYLETKFEFIDCWHFFMNIGLLLGIDGDEFAKLYYLKNQENFARQERGY